MIIGEKGSLGGEIYKQLVEKGIDFIPVTRNELNVTTKINLLESFVINSNANVIINFSLGAIQCKLRCPNNCYLHNTIFLIVFIVS